MSEKFPARLLSARQLRGFSQSELAAKAGLQPSAVSHFETDYLLGRVDKPHLIGGVAEQLFRHAEKMSSNDLDTLTSFAEMLATKAAEKKRG